MIIDASLYYNEEDMAEIRINELKDVVDKFVIVSGSTTFQGNENPHRLPKHLHDLADIEYHVLGMPHTGWQAEHWLREQIKYICAGFNNEDTIIVSDADEIIRSSTVTYLGEPQSLEVDQYYYNFNLYTRHHSCMFSCKIKDLHDVRSMRFDRKLPVTLGAGWEFSFFGDEYWIQNKLKNYSHSELSDMALEDIKSRVESSIDIVERDIPEGAPRGPLPLYVQDNKERFRKYWK